MFKYQLAVQRTLSLSKGDSNSNRTSPCRSFAYPVYLYGMLRKERISVEDGEGERLDAYLAARLEGLSRSAIQRLIDEGQVTVQGAVRPAKYKVQRGDDIIVQVPEARPAEVKPEELDFEILYQDQDIVVVNKPKGMATHPAPGSPAGTLVNALLARVKDLSGIGGVERPGIVHRLDKDTSGVMVVAKNDIAHQNLSRQIQRRTAIRKYLALVWGEPKFVEALVDAPIGRHPKNRQRMAVIKDTERHQAREAQTELRTLERYRGFALLEAKLLTGRTHQIRVHCSFIGHPVVGDSMYGGTKRAISSAYDRREREELEALLANLQGQALHAHELSFDHPTTGERITLRAPAPEDISELLDWLRLHGAAQEESRR